MCEASHILDREVWNVRGEEAVAWKDRLIQMTTEGRAAAEARRRAETETEARRQAEAPDEVVSPSHYTAQRTLYLSGGQLAEAIDVLEAFDLTRNGYLHNVGKYILRAGRKGEELRDLKKARWYLDRLIGRMEGNGAPCKAP